MVIFVTVCYQQISRQLWRWPLGHWCQLNTWLVQEWTNRKLPVIIACLLP